MRTLHMSAHVNGRVRTHGVSGLVSRQLLLHVTGLILACSVISTTAMQHDPPKGGEAIVPTDALWTSSVGGLERTQATCVVLPVTGQPFGRALRITIGADAPDSNATQLTIRNTAPVAQKDVLLASFYVRGAAAADGDPARMMFLFEKATRPWTKSVTQGVVTPQDPDTWKRVLVPFRSVADYTPGDAMVSLRFAFGPQTLEVAGLSVVNFAKTRTLGHLQEWIAEQTPLGVVTVAVRLGDTKQTVEGFGGNFAQPRYGSTEPMDTVGQYNLDQLHVIHARIGIPLNHWTPEKGVYCKDGPAGAALRQMQMMADRKIPITGSVWEGPLWMLPGSRETARVLPRERYVDCIEAVARFLVTARDEYGATVEYFSFNEPRHGVNFKFSPAQMADFIRLAGPRFAALGLKTRFLTADTASGSHFADYALPLLKDESIRSYLGPLAFHCWDVLGAVESKYTAIASLGQQYGKPIWCTEAGHDSGLWRTPDPWASWENALRTALAYERTLRLSGASRMDYWTYQDNYPLVNKDTSEPFPVWHVIRQMEEALAPGSRIATATADPPDLKVLPTAGPNPGQFSLVLVNPVGAGQVTLTGLPARAPVTVVQSTGENQRHTPGKPRQTDNAGRFTVTVPARSVLTLLGGGGKSG